jgi:3-oxoadipate enol-lactonase
VTGLAGEMEILTYDCRGHGRSDRQATLFTTELFARDLSELLDHIGWQTVLVAGCSMGGCVAQAFAAQTFAFGYPLGQVTPPRVTALALIDTTAWYGDDATRVWRERAAGARSKGLEGLVGFQVTRWFSEPFRNEHPELVSAVTRIFLANDLDCYAASCIMLGEADLRPWLARLHMPVSIIVGEEDYATPPVMARQLHNAISESTLTILPGARHLTPIECPDQIALQLLAIAGRAGSSNG